MSVEATPTLRKESDYFLMELSGGSPKVEVICGPEWTPWFDIVQAKRLLRFVLWEKREVSAYYDDGRDEFRTTWEVAEIWDRDVRLFDAAVCPLHHLQMERGSIPIHYGLPSSEFLEAYARFSGGPGFFSGGCVVGDEKEDFGYTCSECARLYRSWSEGWRMQGDKAAQPGATDNPDDAQRLREDH